MVKLEQIVLCLCMGLIPYFYHSTLTAQESTPAKPEEELKETKDPPRAEVIDFEALLQQEKPAPSPPAVETKAESSIEPAAKQAKEQVEPEPVQLEAVETPKPIEQTSPDKISFTGETQPATPIEPALPEAAPEISTQSVHAIKPLKRLDDEFAEPEDGRGVLVPMVERAGSVEPVTPTRSDLDIEKSADTNVSAETLAQPETKTADEKEKTDPPIAEPSTEQVETVPAVVEPIHPVQSAAEPERIEKQPSGADLVKLDSVEETTKTRTDERSIAPAELSLMPSDAIVRVGQPIQFTLRGPERFLKGSIGQYLIRDEWERIVTEGVVRLMDLSPDERGLLEFPIVLHNAIAQAHIIEMTVVGSSGQRIETQAAFRIVYPNEWDGWLGMIHAPYQGQSWEPLNRIGIRGGMAYRMNASRISSLRNAGVPFFVENIAGPYLSAYRQSRDLWAAAVEKARLDPFSYVPLKRQFSFNSRAFADVYARMLREHAEIYKDDAPLFYSLASEPSVTRLAAPFDFDFHPEALGEFRRWLEREVYGTLKALNTSWEMNYERWDDVLPWTTAETIEHLKEGGLNLSPWVDFRAFQDLSFSKVLNDGANGIRRIDTKAKVGITGAMGAFAFGGWDWSRLSKTLDVVECYDLGNGRELWRDLAPGKPAFTVHNLSPEPEQLQTILRTIWKAALEGAPRGTLLWDTYKDPDSSKEQRMLLHENGALTSTGEILGPSLRELAGPLGTMLARSRRMPARVGLVYAPASVSVHWLLEAARLHGEKDWLSAWSERTMAECRQSSQLRLRESWCKLLSDCGLPWRFVSTDEIVNEGLLSKQKFDAVILPQTLALGDLEVAALREYALNGGTLIADSCCARFDGHGRVRPVPPLDDLFGLDTSSEPLWAEAERPLEQLVEFSDSGEKLLSDRLRISYPPAFSDKPKYRELRPSSRIEYRLSPYLMRKSAGLGQAIYLNMNLENYFLWRLKPEEQRTAIAQQMLNRLVFDKVRADDIVDWDKTELPQGTELIRLQLGAEGSGVALFALIRNAQHNLAELGFPELKPTALVAERFRLVLRDPHWAANVLSERAAIRTQVLEGILDPVTPTIFSLRQDRFGALRLEAPSVIEQGQPLELAILPADQADRSPRVYGLWVRDPNGQELFRYRKIKYAADGSWRFNVPVALSDALGIWTVLVRESSSGTEYKEEINIDRKMDK